MKTYRILILEDDLKTLSKLLDKFYLFEDKLITEGKDLSITILSEYTQVEDYINKSEKISFDVILLDRDCKAGGSFHVLDIEKFGKNNIVGISSTPSYNEELRKRGITKIIHKDFTDLDKFSSNVTEMVEGIINVAQFDHYEEFKKRFEKMTDEELLNTYSKDKGKPGWVRARGEFLGALRAEFENRGYIYPTLVKKN